MNYSEEQVKKIIKNILAINNKAFTALEIIAAEELSHGEVFMKSGLSKFVADKCITAFLATGLIEMRLNGAGRTYRITEDGNKVLKNVEGGEF